MLSKRHKEVARALFEGGLSEAEACEQCGVSGAVLRRWLGWDEFLAELDRLCEESRRKTRFILSRFGPVAAVRLVDLVGSAKDDVARRAAMEMVARCLNGEEVFTSVRDGQEGEGEVELSDEEARRMLAVLAGGEGRGIRDKGIGIRDKG